MLRSRTLLITKCARLFCGAFVALSRMAPFQLPPDLWILILMHLAVTGEYVTFRDLFVVDAVARDFRVPVQVWSDCIRQRVLTLTSGLKIGRYTSWGNIFDLTVADTPESIASHKQIARRFLELLKDRLVTFMETNSYEIQELVPSCIKCGNDEHVSRHMYRGHIPYYQCREEGTCQQMWNHENPIVPQKWRQALPYFIILKDIKRCLALDRPYDQFMKRGSQHENVKRLEILTARGYRQDPDKTLPCGGCVRFFHLDDWEHADWEASGY